MDPRRRLVAAAGIVAMILTVSALWRVATAPSMALLYSGLEPGAAGEIIQSLEQTGVTYEIRENAIYVASNRRDELRMTLATQGLPANSGQGYELLDSLSGFGTTAQMFDAAYWRAKEGELARTIVSGAQIRSARVHISNSSSRPFRESAAPTASVTVIGTSGVVTEEQAKALRYLVASAVAGLTPENVSVIDGRNGVVINGDMAGSAPANDNREATLKRNVERLLAARVGPGNAVVEVSVDTVTEQESITERTFDPASRVAVSTDTEEKSNSSKDAKGGGVTVASNLPQGDAAGGGDSSSQNSETRERTNYEVSETKREILRSPGAVRRISVAVLVDGLKSADPTTGDPVWTTRSEEELASLRELVSSTVGFDEARGDIITVKSMQFEAPVIDGAIVTPSAFSGFNLDIMNLIQLAVLAVVSLVLGLFVVRPMLAAPPSSRQPALLGASGLPDEPAPRISPAGPAQKSVGQVNDNPALTGEIDEGPTMSDGFAMLPGKASDGFGGQHGEPASPVERLRSLIADRQDETVEILRTWMEDQEEGA